MGKKISEMTREEFVEYGKNLFLTWSTDDLISPLDHWADDAEFEDTSRPVKKVFKGKKEILDLLQNVYSALSEWRLEVLHAAADGNRLGVEWIWCAVHDKFMFDGIPPRGIKTKIHGSSWITFNEEGKIQQWSDCWNKQTMMDQLSSD